MTPRGLLLGCLLAGWAGSACGSDVRDGLGASDARTTVPDAAAGPDVHDVGSDAPDAGPVDTGAIDASFEVIDAAPSDAGGDVPLDATVEVEVPADRPLQARVRIEATEPVTVHVDVSGPGVQRSLTRGEARPEHAVDLVVLRERSTYDVTVRLRTSQGEEAERTASFETGALQLESRMSLSVVVNDPRREPGLTLFPLFAPNPEYVAVDDEGHIVWHYVDRSGRASGLGMIVRRLDDETLLVRTADGIRIIDAWGRTLRDYRESSMLGLAFHHDAVLVPDGNLLVLSAEIRQTFVFEMGGNVNLLADTVLELDPAGELVRRWRAFDGLDPNRFPGPLSRQNISVGLDWSHANAVHHRAADDSYLVSVRNQHWVVKVGRGSGRVEWVFGEGGDFELLEGTWFTAQHTPSWVGDEMIVYDNGNESDPRVSRAVAYHVDEENFTARQTWSWTVPFFTPAVGDVDRLSSTWLITAGVGQGPGTRPTLYEVTDDGEVVWQLEADRGSIYRAERIPGLTAP